MGVNRIDEEIRSSSQILLLITIAVFTVALVSINLVLQWDPWMIPVLVIGAVACIHIQIFQKLNIRSRNIIFGIFLLFEVFYYTVNARSLTDGTAIFIILIFLLTYTGEKSLHRAGLMVALAALIINFFREYGSNRFPTLQEFLLHSLWQLILVMVASLISSRTVASWNDAELAYRKKISEVEGENQKANDFLVNVSHEIRTPVNAVVGLSSVLLREKLPEKIEGNIKNIYTSGQEISSKIGDILDFTEADMDRLSINLENYNIGTILGDILDRLKFWENRSVEVVVDLEPDVPLGLKGDAIKIRKILWHLIINSLKFTKEGGVYIHVFTVKKDYGVNLVIEVKDTGIGMTENEIEHIYEKFYQTDSGRSRMVGGLGLGIPIVNSFTRAMGGFLTIESIPGQGTTVRVSVPQQITDSTHSLAVTDKENNRVVCLAGFSTITIPGVREYYMDMINHMVTGSGVPFKRVQTGKELEAILEDYNITHLFVGAADYKANRNLIDGLSSSMMVAVFTDKEVKSEPGNRITYIRKPFHCSAITDFLNRRPDNSRTDVVEKLVCPGARALVVDDEPMNLTVAKGILEEYEIMVRTAKSGPEAIEICENEDFDIIFMDHMMPEMDGVEAMKRLRENAAKKDKVLNIVTLTANVISSAREMFMNEGFDGFLSKPIELLELERILRRLLPPYILTYRKRVGEVLRPDKVSWNLSLLEKRGLNVSSGMRYCLDDENFYREYLMQFSLETPANVRQVIRAYENRNSEEYRIHAHLLKLVAKFVGAEELTRTSTQLEKAALAGDWEKIGLLHPALIKNCEMLAADISKCAGGMLN